MPRAPNRVVGERAPARTRSLRLRWGLVSLALMRLGARCRCDAIPMRAVLQLFFLEYSVTPPFFPRGGDCHWVDWDASVPAPSVWAILVGYQSLRLGVQQQQHAGKARRTPRNRPSFKPGVHLEIVLASFRPQFGPFQHLFFRGGGAFSTVFVSMFSSFSFCGPFCTMFLRLLHSDESDQTHAKYANVVLKSNKKMSAFTPVNDLFCAKSRQNRRFSL